MKYIVKATMRTGKREVISREFNTKRHAKEHANVANRASPGANARVTKITRKTGKLEGKRHG